MMRVRAMKADLGMNNSQGINPDSPPAIFMLDGMVQQHPEQRVDHVGDLLLLSILGMDVCHGYQPLLPHRHLQHSASVLPVVVAKQRHVRQEQLLHLQELFRLL